MCELLLVPGQELEPLTGIGPASLAERCTSGGIKRRGRHTVTGALRR